MNSMLNILSNYEKKQIIKTIVDGELSSKAKLEVAETEGEIDESVFKTSISSAGEARIYFNEFKSLRDSYFFDAVHIEDIEEIVAEVIDFEKISFENFISSLKIINEEKEPVGVMVRINNKNITINRFTLPIIKNFFNNREKKIKIIIYTLKCDVDKDKFINIKSSLNSVLSNIYKLMSIGSKKNIITEDVHKIIVDKDQIEVKKRYIDIFNDTVENQNIGDDFIIIGTSFIVNGTTYPMSFLNLNYNYEDTIPTTRHSNISSGGQVCTGSDYSSNSVKGIFRMTVMNADSSYVDIPFSIEQLLIMEYIIYNLDTKDVVNEYGENIIVEEVDLETIESISFKDYSQIGGVISNRLYIKNIAEVFDLIQSSDLYEKLIPTDEATKLYIEYFSNIKTKYTDTILSKIYEKVGDAKLSESSGMRPEIIILDNIDISLDDSIAIIKKTGDAHQSDDAQESSNIIIDDNGLDLSNF